ncbi:hypothetical protein A8F94_14970 [Bacillus sp. FJAT-27225]|nr:hypothetical protein A8F94_14970 [Bacillus sp. FJAT-27225]
MEAIIINTITTEKNENNTVPARNDVPLRLKIAGLLLITSPVLWFVGAVAFMPQLGDFYNPGDSLTKLGALTGQQVAWTVQSLLFFAGTLAAVIGLGLLAGLLKHTRGAVMSRAGVWGIITVTAVYAFILLLRLTAPTDGVRDTNDVPSLLMSAHFGWLGVVAIGLTLLTVAFFGLAFYWSGVAKVMGGLVAVLSVLVLVVLLAGVPLPPVIVYPIAAILGVRLLFLKAPFAH